MKYVVLSFSLLFSLGFISDSNEEIIVAHSGHKHEKKISETEAIEKSKEIIGDLISKKKIDPSWKDAVFQKIEKKKYGKRTEWRAAYSNSKITDEGKKTLYVFMKLSGKYVAANYTGK